MTPLEYLADLSSQMRNDRLDEFDEMSSGLYERNDISNAFFLAIRNFAVTGKRSK